MAIEEITLEQYEEAKEKLDGLNQCLFSLRYDIVNNDYDEDTLQKKNFEIKNLKGEISRTIFTIKLYENFNIERKRR